MSRASREGPPVHPKVGVYLSILENTAILLGNPLLGLQEVGRVTALISFAGTLVRNIAVGVDELSTVNEEIKVLVAGARGPSDAEWLSWRGRYALGMERIDRIEESLGGNS